MKLIYVGDPMCSWCYGFGKEMTALMANHPELELSIMVGGVRAGATDILDDEGKQFRLGHWERVEKLSGLEFNRAAFVGRENFVYDTEPICRAVVASRVAAPKADLLAVFRALQHAFYVDGLDTTNGKVLADVASTALKAGGYPITAAELYDIWAAPEIIAGTKAEFTAARALGVRSFPTLLLENDGVVSVVSPGYAHVSELEQRLQLALTHARTA